MFTFLADFALLLVLVLTPLDMFLLATFLPPLISFSCPLAGFDNYIRRLRPREKGKTCSERGPGEGEERNCRNVWFKEFWTQHFNCTFRSPLPEGRRACTGNETITHEQEGLVPFVGKLLWDVSFLLPLLLSSTASINFLHGKSLHQCSPSHILARSLIPRQGLSSHLSAWFTVVPVS